MDQTFEDKFREFIDFQENNYHPLIWIRGKPKIGKNVYIGFFTIINAKYSEITIGDDCDIGPHVSISCADSHKRCIGLMEEIERKPITLEHHVFVGTHAVIKPGAYIGHHSVVGSSTVVDPRVKIPPYSLVVGNPMTVKEGYYRRFLKK